MLSITNGTNEKFGYNNYGYIRQKISLPSPMLLHITKSWSAKAYTNLIQSCKYFFYLHQLIVIENLVVVVVNDICHFHGTCINHPVRTSYKIKN